jgi:hypothetical protein
MPRPPPSSPLARLPRGGVSWVSALLIVLVVGGGYLGLTYAPVYWLHTEVKQTVRRFMNEAVKNRNDAALVDRMLHKLRTLDTQEVPGDDERPVSVPTIDVEAKDVTWERDTSSTPPTLHVYFEYTRTVQYPFLRRSTEQTLTVDLTEDMTVPDWGPSQ